LGRTATFTYLLFQLTGTASAKEETNGEETDGPQLTGTTLRPDEPFSAGRKKLTF
jgi:hypothetical protein